MKKRMFAFLLGALLGVSFIAGATPPENAGWTTEAKTAFETAKEKKLPVLAFFTGSDWCPFCVKMAKETLPTKEFRDFAKDKLVLLYLDFPRSKAPSKEAQELQKRYNIQGFPTTVVLDAEGKVLGSVVGFRPARDYVSELQGSLDNAEKKK